MPDLPDRDAREAELIRRLGNANIGQQVRRMLGSDPQLTDLTPEFWNQIAAEYMRIFTLQLEDIYNASAQAFGEQIGFAVDWNVVNDRAAAWARQYSYDLVSGITNTNRKRLQQVISGYYEHGWSQAELRDQINGIWGPIRATMIARTEVTRAAVMGEKALADELRRQGVTLQVRWQTRADERVCPVCSPRSEKLQGDGWEILPPAHVGCRCWVNYEPVLETT